jgi:hypothetical protein
VNNIFTLKNSDPARHQHRLTLNMADQTIYNDGASNAVVVTTLIKLKNTTNFGNISRGRGFLDAETASTGATESVTISPAITT